LEEATKTKKGQRITEETALGGRRLATSLLVEEIKEEKRGAMRCCCWILGEDGVGSGGEQRADWAGSSRDAPTRRQGARPCLVFLR